MTTFKANRKFPNPITVTDDPKSHTLALQQIIEALNIGQRRTKEINSSYVRVHELVDAGLIEIVGNQLKLTNAGTAATTVGASALADLTDVDLTGLSDTDILVYNSTSLAWEPLSLDTYVDNGATVYRAASAQTTLNATNTVVTFDTELRDDNGYVDLGTNDDRFTITVSGWYAFSGWVTWNGTSSAGRRLLWFQKNGSTTARYGYTTFVASAALNLRSHASGIEYFSAGDYVQMAAYQDSGTSIVLNIDSEGPRMSIHRLGTAGVVPSVSMTYGAALGRATTQAIPTATDTAVQFTAENRDDGEMADLVASSTRITIPTDGDGWYSISGNMTWAADTGNKRFTHIRVNGSLFVATQTNHPIAAFNDPRASVALVRYMSAGDYIELIAWQDDGVDVNISSASLNCVLVAPRVIARSPSATFSPANPGNIFQIFEDFEHLYRTATDVHKWTATAFGAGSQVLQYTVGDGVHNGVVNLETGTTTTGSATIALQPAPDTSSRNALSLHATDETTIEALIFLDTLPTTAQNYDFRVGLSDRAFSTADCCRMIIGWNGTDVTARIQNIVAAGGGGTTTAAITGLIAARVWIHVKLVMTVSAQRLYINGTLVVSSLNNAPASTVLMNPCITFLKTAGTTEVYSLVDLFWLYRFYSTPRHANLSVL